MERQESSGRLAFANPFYVVALFFLALDLLALAVTVTVNLHWMAAPSGLGWLRVHLLTIGVVVEAIVGSLPRLTAQQFHVPPPGRLTFVLLWILTNSGLSLLLIGMPSGAANLAATGGAFILAAILLLLLTIWRQWAARKDVGKTSRHFYLVAPIFFVTGILMAFSMLLGWPAPGGGMGILEGHVHANVWGFLALVVAGFLLDSIPEWLSRPLRYPRLVGATWLLLVAGATVLVAGPWLGILPLTVVGIALYTGGTVLLLANLIGTISAARRWTPSLVHFGVAYIWMIVPAVVAPAILLATGKLPLGPVEAAAVSGLIAGWVMQIVMAALPLRLSADGHRKAPASWGSALMLNLGVLLIWLSAFLAAGDSSLWLVVAYALILLAWLPILPGLLPRFAIGSPSHS